MTTFIGVLGVSFGAGMLWVAGIYILWNFFRDVQSRGGYLPALVAGPALVTALVWTGLTFWLLVELAHYALLEELLYFAP